MEKDKQLEELREVQKSVQKAKIDLLRASDKGAFPDTGDNVVSSMESHLEAFDKAIVRQKRITIREDNE